MQLFNQLYPYLGFVGSLVMMAGSLITAIPYRGRNGERYSILNHFISELGEKGISRMAFVFNAGMIAGGILFIPFIIGIGLAIASVWSIIGMTIGVLAGIAAIFVGIYSMDRLEPHRIAAMTFFRSGLVMVILFTVAIFAQPKEGRVIPLAINIFGGLAVLSYASFLVIVSQKTNKKGDENYLLDPTEKRERPRFWRTPFVEWMIFFATIAWFMSTSISQIH